MTMDLPEGNADMLSDIIAETRVVDDQTFEVKLKERNASFLNGAVVAMVASIVSQDAVEANGGVEAGQPNEYMATNMVGTGPYKFNTWNRAENITLDINDDYWGEKAKLAVRIEIGSDPDVRVLGLRAGEFDIIETDASFVADIEGAEGVTLYSEGLLLEPLIIGLNLNIPEGALPPEDTIPTDFFHDPRIRQAFNHAFDYEAFLNGPLSGFGGFNPHFIPQGIFGYDPTAPVYAKQDLAKAEQLFKEAGYWDEGFTVSIITEEANLFAAQALVLKDSAGEAQPEVPGERPVGRRSRCSTRRMPRTRSNTPCGRRMPILPLTRIPIFPLRPSGRRLGRGARLRQRLQGSGKDRRDDRLRGAWSSNRRSARRPMPNSSDCSTTIRCGSSPPRRA